MFTIAGIIRMLGMLRLPKPLLKSGSRRVLTGIARSRLALPIGTLREGIKGIDLEAIGREEEGTGETEEIEGTEEVETGAVAVEAEEENVRVATEEKTTAKRRRRCMWIRTQAKHHQTNRMSSSNSSNKNNVKA